MTVGCFVYFQFLLCLITGVVDGMRVIVNERCLKLDCRACGEEG